MKVRFEEYRGAATEPETECDWTRRSIKKAVKTAQRNGWTWEEFHWFVRIIRDQRQREIPSTYQSLRWQKLGEDSKLPPTSEEDLMSMYKNIGRCISSRLVVIMPDENSFRKFFKPDRRLKARNAAQELL